MHKYYFLLFMLLVAGRLNAQIEAVEVEEGSKENQEVTEIVVVFKMHVDIGYTDWAEGVLQKYTGSMLDETLRSIDETSGLPENERFVWTIPGWPLKYMLENTTGEKKKKLETAVRTGRIVPHALPVTFETEAGDLENLVRGLEITSGINAKFGLPEARDAKLTDVPSHSWLLPTLLKNAGIDFLHLGCNPGSASPDVPRLFWWEGPDGAKLLTLYWAEYYGSGILPPKDWPHKTWLAMIHTHENTGAPNPGEVAALLQEAREKMPGVRIKIGRLSDFYDLLMKENPELPVVKGDMPDTWIHGYMSHPVETRLSKFLQRETYHTELMHNQLKLWGIPQNETGAYIKEAAENIMLYDEHTFGAAMTHGNQHKWTFSDEFKVNNSLGHYDYIEGTWIEKSNRIRKAEKIVKPMMHRQLKDLAASVKVDGKRIVVYNPLPWIRSGRVNFFAGIYKKNFRTYALKDMDSGKLIPVYEDYNLLSFDADSVPSLGYKTYVPVLEPVPFEDRPTLDKVHLVLENSYFRLQMDGKKGTIVSLVDKHNRRELVSGKAKEGFGAYFLEQPGQDMIDEYNKNYVKPGAEGWANTEMIRGEVPFKERRIYRGTCDTVFWQDMGNAVRATVKGTLNDKEKQTYLVTYTLYENQPYVEVNWGVDGKKPNPLPEAGWLSFPFAVQKPEYRLYRTGGIVDPQKDFVENTNFDYCFLNTSMALYGEDGAGIGLNCPESPGVSIDRPGLFRFSGKRQLKTGTVFVNVYNNQWGTNFAEWIEGSFSSKMYIWSYGQYDAEKSFITPSEETRSHLKAGYHNGKAGTLPIQKRGLTLSRKGILVTAYYEGEEGSILRLWEQAGQEGVCEIALLNGSGYNRAYPCNLRNEIIDEAGIAIVDDTFKVMMEANAPKSFILK